MKHTERLDQVLLLLYNHRDDPSPIDLFSLLVNNRIDISENEIYRVTDRLEEDDFVKCNHYKGGCLARITSKGMEFCEENSYSNQGKSLLI